MKKTLAFLTIGIISFCMLLFFADTVLAGFGISPPYVTNHNLSRGSNFEKDIWLTRGNPVEDLRAEIEIDVPGANDWISVDKGNSFILPKGEQKISITVSVSVPKNAEYKSYPGFIRITTYPVNSAEGGGQVAIILGARIDVSLDVKDIEIFDFEIKRIIGPHDLEEGHNVLWWFSPGKIKFDMEIENTGNVKVSPTKVLFEIYDGEKKSLIETITAKKIGKVDPFQTKNITAELSTKLAAGSYWAIFKIFKGDEIVEEGETHLSILPRGEINPIPKEWYGLAVWIWILTILVILGLCFAGLWFYMKKKKL